MSHWASAPLNRNQVALFAPTLDDNIAADHPVRLFDEVLRGIDFAEWESVYVLKLGQPPIHPRIMAAGILYGLSLGIRSSRKLEEGSVNRLDFIWLLEGRTPDHATVCKFRTQFGEELKGLFRKVGRVAIEMGMVTLNQVTLDGTAWRSNNSRFNTAHRPSLEQKLSALDEQIDTAMKQAAQKDQEEDQLYGTETSPVKLPRSLSDLKRRQERLREALKNLESMEADRAARGERKDVSDKGPAVPLSDPDSRVLPNKPGGYAPNYTGVLAVDSGQGIILDTQLLGGNDEASTVLPAVANIKESFGAMPGQLAADSGFNSGQNLTDLEKQGVEPLMPAKQEFDGVNPAVREDLSQPVPEKDHAALPMNPQNKILDKSAFAYDAGKDQYVCPMSRVLFRVKDKPYDRHGTKGIYQMYECASCAGCPLAGRCLPKNAAARRVSRDEHETSRERMAARMSTEEGAEQYKRRAWAAETPFGVFKTTMNFRQFLLRGLKKAAMELRWMATAYNLVKLIRFKAAAALKTATAATAQAIATS
jgi:transposase